MKESGVARAGLSASPFMDSLAPSLAVAEARDELLRDLFQ